MAAGGRKKKDKVPYPGTKGEKETLFYTKKKWRALMQMSTVELAGRSLGPRGALLVSTAMIKSLYVTTVDFSQNNIGDSGAIAIANMLQLNTTIQSLNLSQNSITDMGGIAIASAFIPNVSPNGQPGRWNRTLFTLILMGNALGEDTLLAMSNAAACHRDLTSIDLSWNQIGPQGSKCMMRAYQRNPLCVYNLSANHLGDAGTITWCEALHRYGGKSQTTINLYQNDLSHGGAEAVAKLVANTDMILEVNLAGNTIGFKGAEAIRIQLTAALATRVPPLTPCTLRSLNLSDNWLGDEGAMEVAKLIEANIASLEWMDVSSNKITDVGLTAVIQALRQNSSMVTMNCDGNSMGAKAVAAVEQLIRETQTLRVLNLSDCINSSDHRRTVMMAVGETDSLHVELGAGADAAEDGEGGFVARMEEHLQMLADQEAQRERDNPKRKKKGSSKKKKSTAKA